jgi:hypothetical protein
MQCRTSTWKSILLDKAICCQSWRQDLYIYCGADEHFDEDTHADFISEVVEADVDPPPLPPPPVPSAVARRPRIAVPVGADPAEVLPRAVPEVIAPRQAWSRIDHPSKSGYLRMSKTTGKLHWDFRAVCNLHGCSLTRHGRKEGLKDGTSQGRPLGFLWLFLQVATDPRITDKASHRRFADWAFRDARRIARDRFALIDGSALFFAEERDPWTGEGNEPVAYPE